MAKEEQEAGQPQAPAIQSDESFGTNDGDFWVDEETGAVFIGDTAVVGRGRRPAPPAPPPQAEQPSQQQRLPLDETGTRDEDFQMDDKGNLDIAGIRVKEEGIDNTDHIAEEFSRGRLTADEMDELREEHEAKHRSSQAKAPEPSPPKEWALRALDKEVVVKDESELLKLAQKGLGADRRFEEVAEMRKEIEPFYKIALKLKEDPGFVEHVKNYGQATYQVDGPEPFTVAPEQFDQLVNERVQNQLQAGKIYWEHDKKYGGFNGYPKADEVRQKLLADSLHWDKFTRDWVDKNPVAYADKFQQTANRLIRERMLDPEPARPIPPHIIEKQKQVLEKLRAKEVAKERAKVESAKSVADVQAQDGRLALNRARKRAAETGSVADWADVIAKMGYAD